MIALATLALALPAPLALPPVPPVPPVQPVQTAPPAPQVPGLPNSGDLEQDFQVQLRALNAPAHSILSTLDPLDDGGLGIVDEVDPGVPMVYEMNIGGVLPQIEITLFHTKAITGYQEKFILQLPKKVNPANPRPLLVFFHKFGSTFKDVNANTLFPEEAWRRNWFLLSPLGGSTKHFNALPAQINIEIVLETVLDRLGDMIDRSRVYGVGFSMGGGTALNFAARHLDPELVQFAGIVDHTGSLAHKHTYEAEGPVFSSEGPSAIQEIFHFWFGGDYVDFPFDYERTSVLDMDPVTNLVRPKTSLAINLTHVPVLIVMGESDPIEYARLQSLALVRHLTVLGGEVELEVVPGITEHKWDTLDATFACDWLETRSLELPTRATTLADRDGVYFHFEVVQDTTGAFSPFDWEVDEATNSIVVQRTANIAELVIHTERAGLRATETLRVSWHTEDGSPDRILLRDVPERPLTVLRDGVAADGQWHYRKNLRTLEISEPGGAMHHWTVVPPSSGLTAPAAAASY